VTSPVQFPNPAVLETRFPLMVDDVTDTSEEQVIRRYIGGVASGIGDGGVSVGWDDLDHIRGVILSSVEDQGDWIVGTSAEGQVYKFRPMDPYDAVDMGAGAGVPQPLQVVQAAVIRGGVLADSLDAVVAADNTVATLMLETGMGTFVRYGGDWQLLRDDSGALDDMGLVSVAPGALDVWDAADSAGQTISVFDLPQKGNDGEVVNPEPSVDVETAAAIAASGISIPQIASEEDLDLGIRYANSHPEARWYVSKRARALAASARIPAHWNVVPVAVAPPFAFSGREMEM
jgi:hypothetical protein